MPRNDVLDPCRVPFHHQTAVRIVLLGAWMLVGSSAAVSRVHGQEASEAPTDSFRLPVYPDKTPPPLRTREEVARLLAPSDAATESPDVKPDEPLDIVLVAGPKDHGKGEHDYPAWQQVWQRLLREHANTRVSTAMEFPTAEQIAAADVLVFYQRGSWTEERAAAIDPFLARGGGLVYIHWAVDGRGQQDEMARRIGLSALGGGIRYRHGELHLDFTPGNDHPIARNFEHVRWIDESYWRLSGDPAAITVLGTSREDDAAQPQFWVVERGRGRVFVSIPGHYMWTFDDPTFRTLLLRGIAWVGRRDVDRFNELVTLDARIAP
jgi:type 1 glutamine amidotransferase